MNTNQESTLCPVCLSSTVQFAFNCTDYSITKEIFEIWECSNCQLRYTIPVPSEADMGRYYVSEKYISHSDTSAGLINKLYKLVRNITLSEKRRMVQRATGITTGQLLDVGAGTGAFLYEMKEAGWQVSGIEPDEGARKRALDNYHVQLESTPNLFKLPPESFDAITLWHVLEHVEDLEKYLLQLKSLLKPNGILFIAVPNYTSTDGVHYGKFWAAYDVPRHLYHFAPKSMVALAKRTGFIMHQKRVMWFDAYYIAMLSEKYKNGSPRLFTALLQGLWGTMSTLFDRENSSSLIYLLKK
jgi:2-polyprenyl-3-methyl-5-hydroxy-6-metoxy-1,4-benzoquinol methylase